MAESILGPIPKVTFANVSANFTDTGIVITADWLEKPDPLYASDVIRALAAQIAAAFCDEVRHV